MILRPDEYAHQNNSLSIVDELNVRGGRRVVQDLQELYGLHAYQDKLKDNITIVRVISEDKDYRLIDKNIANTEQGWVVNSAISPPEIQVSKTEPTDVNIKLWGKLPLSSDLDILRQIRDANPTSQLPALWLDSEDPYTQWEGVTWNSENVVGLIFDSLDVASLQNINKLSELTRLSCEGGELTQIDLTGLSNLGFVSLNDNKLTSLNVLNLTLLQILGCSNNKLTLLNIDGLNSLKHLYFDHNQITDINLSGLNNLIGFGCNNNKLTNLDTLTSKKLITTYNFTYNNFPTAELNRFRAMGFTNESKLLPQN